MLAVAEFSVWFTLFATLWWRLDGHTGILVAIWLGEQVLLVRHSYKPGLRLPSGGVRSGEDHCLAAVRELQEEVGLTMVPYYLRLVSAFKGPYGMNYLYEAELVTKPNLWSGARSLRLFSLPPRWRGSTTRLCGDT